MTAPAIKIEIGFESTASLGSNFILDAGPVITGQGTLDNTSFTLAGTVYVDVSAWATSDIGSNRGRSRETDQYQAGTLNFTLRNEDRRFDPSNTASPYYPGIKPRQRVNAYIAGVQIFGGYIDDYTVSYEIPNTCVVAVTCVDGFGVAANTPLMALTVAQQLSSDRVKTLLDSVDFPATRNISTGNTTLQPNIINSTPDNPVQLLDALQTATRSENGYLFCDKAGVLTFFNRYHLAGATSSVTFSDLGVSDGIGYQSISQKSQALLLYNLVTGTRNADATGTIVPAPVAKSASDATSIIQYLTRGLQLGQLECLGLGSDPDSAVADVCAYLVGRYSQPDVRFDTITIELQSLSVSQLAAVLALDLVQLATVKRTPPGTGTPTTVTKISVVDGIKFALNVSSSTYVMTIQFSSFDTRNFFILDDPTFGILDSSKLGY